MDNQKKGISLLAAGFTGMVIGAGMGAAAMRLITDKKTRDMVMDSFNNAREKVVSYAHELRGRAKRAGSKAKEELKHMGEMGSMKHERQGKK